MIISENVKDSSAISPYYFATIYAYIVKQIKQLYNNNNLIVMSESEMRVTAQWNHVLTETFFGYGWLRSLFPIFHLLLLVQSHFWSPLACIALRTPWYLILEGFPGLSSPPQHHCRTLRPPLSSTFTVLFLTWSSLDNKQLQRRGHALHDLIFF